MKIRRFALLIMGFVLFGCGGDGGDSEPPIDCQPPKPHFSDGACVQCLEDGHCGGGQSCDMETGDCVCPDETPYPEGDSCWQCTEDVHCEGGYCDDCLRVCVTIDGGCDRAYVCNGVCTECLSDQDCSDGTSCDPGAGACVENPCDDPLPFIFAGECVACLDTDDCPGELVCGQKVHACHCEDTTLKVFEGQCVQCLNSLDCPQGQMCDTKEHICEGETVGCPDETPFWWQGECVECLDDTNCPEEGSSCHLTKHFCLPPPLNCEGHTPHEYQGECVQCLSYEHCLEGKVCDFETHKCVEGGGTGECMAQGTGTHIGDQIGNFILKDNLGNEIGLHNYCGEAKAIWIVSVAGWCGACAQWAPQAEQLWQQYKGQGLQLLFLIGEDAGGNIPTQAYVNQWAASHQVTAPVLIDPHWQNLDQNISTGGNSLPWDYILDGDDMTFVWESVVPNTNIMIQEIEKLLAD